MGLLGQRNGQVQRGGCRVIMKIWKRGLEMKPASLAGFYRVKQCLGGIDTVCRTCRNAQRKAWKHKNAERVRAQRRELYLIRNGPRLRAKALARHERFPFQFTAEILTKGIYERARDRGFEVSPELRTKAFVEAWLRRQPACECCGVTFHIGPKNGQKTDASPSFDRFNSAGGYTLGNTALICWRCNNIKRNYEAEDLERVAGWIKRRSAWGNETGKFGAAA